MSDIPSWQYVWETNQDGSGAKLLEAFMYARPHMRHLISQVYHAWAPRATSNVFFFIFRRMIRSCLVNNNNNNHNNNNNNNNNILSVCSIKVCLYLWNNLDCTVVMYFTNAPISSIWARSILWLGQISMGVTLHGQNWSMEKKEDKINKNQRGNSDLLRSGVLTLPRTAGSSCVSIVGKSYVGSAS